MSQRAPRRTSIDILPLNNNDNDDIDEKEASELLPNPFNNVNEGKNIEIAQQIMDKITESGFAHLF